MTQPPQILTGLSGLLDRYDAFVFDVWGVLHDGRQCFPDILPTLRKLRAAGKRVGILSNSPRPIAAAAEHIRRFGLTPDRYDALLTSGQLVFEALRDRPEDWQRALGDACIHIGTDEEFALYAPAGLRHADEHGEARFIFVTSVADDAAPDDFLDLFTACLAAGLPLLCANPDGEVVKDGRPVIAAGHLAQLYAERGGKIYAHYGKPHPEIFHRMLRQLQTNAPRALMIGDNLATDISGAQAIGMATMLITDGVHKHALEKDGAVTPETLQNFLRQKDAAVDYAMGQVVFH